VATNLETMMQQLFRPEVPEDEKEETTAQETPEVPEVPSTNLQGILSGLFAEEPAPEPTPTPEPAPEPTTVDQDVPVGLQAPAPQPQPEVQDVPQREVIPTSLTGFYGEDLLNREQELLGRVLPQTEGIMLKDMSPSEIERALNESGLTSEESAELRNIFKQKEDKYNAVTGENVVSMDVTIPGIGTMYNGKIITDEDGQRKFLPPPTANEITQTFDKALLDTARGIAGMPEILGFEGFQKAIPTVSTENEAALIAAELLQLTTGGMAVLKLADKAPKLIALAEKVPAFKSFVKGVDDFTPEALEKVYQYVKLSTQGLPKAVPKGAIPVSVGAAVAADEDIATFFGDPNMTMAEAKTQMLIESMAFGVALNFASAAGEITRVAPGLRYLGRNLSAGFAALFSGPKKLDERVIEELGQIVYENNKRLANAKTQDEINAIYEEMYEQTATRYKNLTGKDLNETLAGVDMPPPAKGEYAPSLGEVLGEEGLIRLFVGLSKKGGTEAEKLLAQLLTTNEQQRLRAIGEKVEIGRAQLAPEGEAAGIEARQAIAPQIERETAEIEARAAAERKAAEEAAEARRAQAEAVEEAEVRRTELEITGAEEELGASARDLQRTLERSNAAKTRLDDINEAINDDGTMQILDDVLKKDLETKATLGAAKDEAYRAVTIAPEQSAQIVDDMLARIGSEDFIRANPEFARGAVGKFIRMFRGDEAVVPVPGAPAVPKGQLDEQLAKLQDELDKAVTAQDIARISLQMRQLIQRGAKPKAPGAIAEEGEAIELPTINLRDLEIIAMSARDSQVRASSAALNVGGAESRVLYQLSRDFQKFADDLTAQVDSYVSTSLPATKARDDFNMFFEEFKPRWRTKTGKEWQKDIIGSRTDADINATADKIIAFFANPKATSGQRTQIKSLFDAMPDDVQGVFANNIGRRLLAKFTQSKGVMPKADNIENIAQARQVLDRLNEYLQGMKQYEDVIPGALEELRFIKTSLEKVTKPAERAKARVATAEAEAKVTKREARRKAKAEERAISTEEAEQLAQINRRFKQAEKAINTSTLQKFLEVDDPIDFLGRLFRDQQGAKKFNELWTRAGMQGDKLDSGLTQAQQSLSEASMESLLTRVYTPTQELGEVTKLSIVDIANIILRPNSTQAQIFATATNNNPAAKEFISQLGRTAQSYQRSLGGAQVAGSRTADVGALEKIVTDVQMVAYGPLTKEFRLGRFLTGWLFKLTGGEARIAEATARVMTQEKYYTRVLEQSKKIAERGLVSQEEAFSTALGVALLSAAGYNKYDDLENPEEQMFRDFKQYATVQQTQEAFPQTQEPTVP
jgi:hypothetical protein